jgi:pyruvate,orthophosphate dikinase
LGHRRQCAGDGVRQSRNHIGHRRCLYRDPSTGERILYGEFLINAQGEDVVAGIRTPQSITKRAREAGRSKRASMEEAMPDAFAELSRIASKLEAHYRDMQDVEFTVQEGKLFMLQTRSGKRTARAALRVATEMVREGLINEDEAVLRVDPAALDQLLHPTLDPNAPKELIAAGLAASPGAASGEAVFTADEAEHAAGRRTRRHSHSARNQPRRHSWHARRQGNPDRARRHDQPRGCRGTRHGASLRHGCGHAEGGCRTRDYEFGQCHDLARRYHHHRWCGGKVYRGRVPMLLPEMSDDFAKLMQWA